MFPISQMNTAQDATNVSGGLIINYEIELLHDYPTVPAVIAASHTTA
jgi:hypothetical protein